MDYWDMRAKVNARDYKTGQEHGRLCNRCVDLHWKWMLVCEDRSWQTPSENSPALRYGWFHNVQVAAQLSILGTVGHGGYKTSVCILFLINLHGSGKKRRRKKNNKINPHNRFMLGPPDPTQRTTNRILDISCLINPQCHMCSVLSQRTVCGSVQKCVNGWVCVGGGPVLQVCLVWACVGQTTCDTQSESGIWRTDGYEGLDH